MSVDESRIIVHNTREAVVISLGDFGRQHQAQASTNPLAFLPSSKSGDTPMRIEKTTWRSHQCENSDTRFERLSDARPLWIRKPEAVVSMYRLHHQG